MSFPTFPIQSLYRTGIFKPTSVAFTTASTGTALGTNTHTNDANAYDVSIATAAELNVVMDTPAIASGTKSHIATYSGFGTGNMVGQLSAYVTSTTAKNMGSTANAISTVEVQYSLDGGGTWNPWALASGNMKPLSNVAPILKPIDILVDLALLQVKFILTGAASYVGPSDNATADADLLVYDISFF